MLSLIGSFLISGLSEEFPAKSSKMRLDTRVDMIAMYSDNNYYKVFMRISSLHWIQQGNVMMR